MSPPLSPGLNPKSEKQPRKGSPVVHGLVKAESLMQIAFILPTALLIGWGGGVLLDKWLHQHWIYIVGIIFGIVAGMIEAVRQALSARD